MNTRIRGAQINLADVAIDVATDSLAFFDATDSVIKRESVIDFVSGIGGNGLAGNGDGTLKLNLYGLLDDGIEVANDSVVFIDATDNSSKKVSFHNMISNSAGSGLTTINGIFSVAVDDASIELQAVTGGNVLAVKNAGITDSMLVEDYIKVSELDGTTLEVITGGIVQIVDGGVDASKLSATGGSTGQVLTKGTGDTLSWISIPGLDIIGLDEVLSGTEIDAPGDYLALGKGTVTGAPTWKISVTTFLQNIIDGTSIGLNGSTLLEVINGSINVEKLDVPSGTPGQILSLGTGDSFVWINAPTPSEDYVQETEIITENHSADILVTGFAGVFELGFAPILGSVQVFLNGLLQEDGTGKDYQIGGTGNKIVTFDTAPVLDDIVIIHYIKS